MLNIAGDINLTDAYFNKGIGIGSSIARGNDPFAKLERKEEDVWIGNFEGVSSSVSENQSVFKHAFNLHPMYLKNIKHIDIYNLANNHSMEHGADAFLQTIENLRAHGSRVFGLNNERTITFTHKGKKCSITGFSQRKEVSNYIPLYWYNPDLDEIRNECKKIASSDLKIAYVHWGNEFVNRPYNDQRLFAHALIDIGYDLVVGMHPHILQGYEMYNGKYIYYSIGNFVFDMGWEPLRYGAFVQVDWDEYDNLIVSNSYVCIEKDYFPVVVDESKVPSSYRFEYLNSLIKYDMNNEEYYALVTKCTSLYHKYNRRYILKSFFRMYPKDTYAVLLDFISRKFRR